MPAALNLTPADGPVDVGNLVAVQATFTDKVTGALVDPTTVWFAWTTPQGARTTWQYNVSGSITRVSQGLYQANVDTSALPGRFTVRFWSTGTGQAAVDGYFDVAPSPLSP